MKVHIKEFNVMMAIKKKGIELQINTDSKHLGDLVITQAGLRWCPGKTGRKHGTHVRWSKFIDLMKRVRNEGR